MINVNLNIGSRYPLNRKLLREKVEALLIKQGINHAEVDISVVGNRKMIYLNEEIVHHEGTTDVLSFPHHELGELDDFPMPAGIPPHLGEVVICYPVAVEVARKRRKLVDEQLGFYAEHGLLHLLGHHHNDGME